VKKMRYLFWNTHKNKKINPILCNLISENHISIVVLAEYDADAEEEIKMLNTCGYSMQQYTTTGCERIHILAKRGLDIEPQLQTSNSSMQFVNRDIILCCVHLNSQIYSSGSHAREIRIRQIVSDILKAEKELSTTNTVIVGDLNINPYDQSCISAQYLHGIPIYEETKRNSRVVAGETFYMFYNPMWNFLGDFSEPFGTYYYNSSDDVNTYWNIFDQVIIRPTLRRRFVQKSLKILTGTEKISLLNSKRHPNCEISDHLPIIFEIKENDHEF
jgi:hypothetical protein